MLEGAALFIASRGQEAAAMFFDYGAVFVAPHEKPWVERIEGPRV
jgi:hypothetical protein